MSETNRGGTSTMAFSQRIAVLLGAVLFGAAIPAAALESEGDLAGIQFSIYAPDWTWQGRDVNVMAVFENPTAVAATCAIALEFDGEQVNHFGRNGAPITPDSGPLVNEVSVPPGETRRIALTGITALNGFPRQVYPLTLRVDVNASETRIAYPMRTIRGQAFSEGRAIALGIPIGVALIFAVAFAAVLRKSGDPDAWKTVPAPATVPEKPESWINQIPK